jgi:hypothetical protein
MAQQQQAGMDPNQMAQQQQPGMEGAADEFGETQFNEGDNFEDPAFDDFENEEDWS